MKTILNYEVKENIWPERTYVLKRDKVSFNKLPEFFGSNYDFIYRVLKEMNIESTEPPFAIYYSVDEVNKVTDLAAAILINQPIKKIEGLELMKIPSSKVISVDYYGPYDLMAPAYETLERYTRDHGYQKKLIIEQYFTDPMVESDPEKWKTTIYFMVN